MKKINIYSFVLTVIIALITIYNQFYNNLAANVSIAMWLLLCLLVLPFLLFTLYCNIINRLSRRFKTGDIVIITGDNDHLYTVVDYCAYRPSIVIITPLHPSNSIVNLIGDRIDHSIKEKLLQLHIAPPKSTEIFDAYIKGFTEGSGHAPIQGTLKEL